MSRQILVNAFDMNCPTHLVAGTWRDPESDVAGYKDLEYWTELAQICERGLFDGIFIADVLGVYDVFGGSPDAALRAGAQVPVNDPSLVVPAMAAVTKHLGFGVTCSTSFEHPYTFARRMSTLDHLTKGRVGWNIVTSYLESGARNVGLDGQVRHDNRYDIADEYMEVLYKLWEGSWEDDAVVADAARNIYVDPEKVHSIEHAGEHFKVPGIHLSEPSPQRTPLLYQAGASSRGIEFAADHAEAVFMGASDAAEMKKRVAKLRARLAEVGRDPYDIKVFGGYSVVVAPTDAEAEEKHQHYLDLKDPEGTLTLWSGWMGFDLSPYGLDEPLKYVPNEAMQSINDQLGDGKWTVRDLIYDSGMGASGQTAVGGPETVADQIEEWIDSTDSDGLNLNHIVTPGSYRDFAELVVPELQRRGRYRTSYDEGTLREKLFGRGSRLPETHRADQYRRSGAAVAATTA